MTPFDPSYRSQITETDSDRKSRAAKTRAPRLTPANSVLGNLRALTPEERGRDRAKLRRAI